MEWNKKLMDRYWEKLTSDKLWEDVIDTSIEIVLILLVSWIAVRMGKKID
ncbi:hypothetical protein OL548_05075 [Lysinibacillus sp. MHQ-1]|nr:hypothetical protein OL548_05075 [Lysinibacillus sp. MHQ-1]